MDGAFTDICEIGEDREHVDHLLGKLPWVVPEEPS